MTFTNTESETEEQLIKMVISIDNKDSKSLMPWPHDPHRGGDWPEYEGLSIRDRLAQLDVPQESKDIFEAFTSTMSLVPSSAASFTDLLHWQGLSGHGFSRLSELSIFYKIGDGGMTSLARAMYKDFKGDSIFSNRVISIDQSSGNGTTIKLENGKTLRSKVVISTIPL